MEWKIGPLIMLVLSFTLIFGYVWLGQITGDRRFVDSIAIVPMKEGADSAYSAEATGLITPKDDGLNADSSLVPQDADIGTEEGNTGSSRQSEYVPLPEYDIVIEDGLPDAPPAPKYIPPIPAEQVSNPPDRNDDPPDGYYNPSEFYEPVSGNDNYYSEGGI